jgi:aldose 1-epimerase
MTQDTKSQRTGTLPTGTQVELRYGDMRAVVTEVGATLRSFEVAGHKVIDGFASDEMSPSGRGQVLCPWPNRIDKGEYEFLGQQYQLPLSEPENSNAIHGLVRWMNWKIVEHTEHEVRFSLRLHPQDGYPFLLDLQLHYALGEGGLVVTTSARNAGNTPIPFGVGYHPYLTIGTELVNDALLVAPAETYYIPNDRMIPVERAPVAGTKFDFRSPRPIGSTVFDTALTDLKRDKDGLARFTLTHPSGSPTITVAMGAPYKYAVLYSGDTLPDEARRRRGFAIEPMTCAVNAFCSGDGLMTLHPDGPEYIGTWSINLSR